MLILVSGATAALRAVHDDRFGVLIVPTAGNARESLPLIPGRCAMDNGGYHGVDKVAFLNMLKRYYGFDGFLWVTAPDVVGDSAATLERWPFWSALIRGVGFPPALVAQDGLTVATTPWSELGGLFIGGSTEWKVSEAARTLVAYALARGIHVHMGRVNTRERLRIAYRWGVQSIDGSSRPMFGETQLRKDQRHMDEWHREPELAF